MRLEEIENIEILKKTIKNFLSKCVLDYTIRDYKFVSGEWYRVDQYSDRIVVFPVNDDGLIENCATYLNSEEVNKIFDLN